MGIGSTLPLVFFALVLGGAASAGVQTDTSKEPAPSGRDEDVVAAKVGDVTILLSEVETLADAELARMELEYRKNRHQLLDARLHDLVERKLLELEAQRTGKTLDALVAEAMGGVGEVSDADVDAWYETNKGRLQGRTKEDLAPQIRQYLQEQARNDVRRELFQRLSKTFDVSLLFQPFAVEIETKGYPFRGPEEAPVTLVEFSDFECPFCHRFNDTLKQVRESYPDKVRIVFRQFPLDMHPHARKAAEASLCAFEQGRFWEMHDLLFSESTALAVSDLKEKAARLGLDAEAFGECLDSDSQRDRVEADVRAGAAVGVTGTPALFLNGQPLEGGAVPFETLRDSIEKELARQ